MSNYCSVDYLPGLDAPLAPRRSVRRLLVIVTNGSPTQRRSTQQSLVSLRGAGGYRTLMTAVRALLVIRASLVAIVKPRRVA